MRAGQVKPGVSPEISALRHQQGSTSQFACLPYKESQACLGTLQICLALAGHQQAVLRNMVTSQFPSLILLNASCCTETGASSGTWPQASPGTLLESGHCPFPESFSKQPLPFGVLCLIVVLPWGHQGLRYKEFCIPFHVFPRKVEEDLSGAPQAAKEEYGRRFKFSVAAG